MQECILLWNTNYRLSERRLVGPTTQNVYIPRTVLLYCWSNTTKTVEKSTEGAQIEKKVNVIGGDKCVQKSLFVRSLKQLTNKTQNDKGMCSMLVY